MNWTTGGHKYLLLPCRLQVLQVTFAVTSPIASLATSTGGIFLARHAFCLQKVMLNYIQEAVSALVLVSFYLFLVDPCL
jgi:hypothetical protein